MNRVVEAASTRFKLDVGYTNTDGIGYVRALSMRESVEAVAEFFFGGDGGENMVKIGLEGTVGCEVTSGVNAEVRDEVWVSRSFGHQ